MGNVVVHEVSQPAVNQKVSTEVQCAPFIENLGGACMHSNHTGANPHY